MTTTRHQITEHNAAAMLKAFAKQINEGRVFTVQELEPILAYAAVLLARHQEEIEVLAQQIVDIKRGAIPVAAAGAADKAIKLKGE